MSGWTGWRGIKEVFINGNVIWRLSVLEDFGSFVQFALVDFRDVEDMPGRILREEGVAAVLEIIPYERHMAKGWSSRSMETVDNDSLLPFLLDNNRYNDRMLMYFPPDQHHRYHWSQDQHRREAVAAARRRYEHR